MNDMMKAEFQRLVKGLKEEGNINLKETPVVFTWAYEEDPYIHYELCIVESDQGAFDFANTVTH